jgi:signal transduction histidine kinase/ActR/RegA family two-component response regulator
MTTAPRHTRERERLAALRSLEILDSDGEQAYDDLVRLASSILDAPIALVSLVDAHRQWFKARHGLDAQETPRELAFCAHAIVGADSVFVVEDASLDARFADNALVQSFPNIRFYAGCVLHAPSSELPLGTLCVIDRKPRSLSAEQRSNLSALARQVERLLTLRAATLQLSARNAELEHATRAKSRFFATVSHDIRTPLHGIVGAAELLARLQLPEEGRRYTRTIEACSNSLLHLVDGVLDISRIESGAIELAARPFDLRRTVRDVCDVLHERATAKGLTLTLEDHLPHNAMFVGDEARVHQILLNLAANAVKFTARGHVKVIARHEPEGLHLGVRDTGPGVALEDRERIFEPFVQGSDPKHRSQGSGLGLNIVRSLTQLMGGSVELISEPGHGSTFMVALSLPKAAPGACAPLAPIPARLDGVRVLAADDDPTNRTLLAAMLQHLGVPAQVLSSGAEVLDAEVTPETIVLMDGHMPEPDGLETTRRWRARESAAGLERTKILALSASAFEEDRRNYLAAGMDDVLVKPLTIDGLARALKAHSARAPSRT